MYCFKLDFVPNLILKLDHDHNEGLCSKLDFETLQFSNAIVLNFVWFNLVEPTLHCESASC